MRGWLESGPATLVCKNSVVTGPLPPCGAVFRPGFFCKLPDFTDIREFRAFRAIECLMDSAVEYAEGPGCVDYGSVGIARIDFVGLNTPTWSACLTCGHVTGNHAVNRDACVAIRASMADGAHHRHPDTSSAAGSGRPFHCPTNR